MQIDREKGVIIVEETDVKYASLHLEETTWPIEEAHILYGQIAIQQDESLQNLARDAGVLYESLVDDSDRLGCFQASRNARFAGLLLGRLAPLLPKVSEDAEAYLREVNRSQNGENPDLEE